jgi:hypothetical protein
MSACWVNIGALRFTVGDSRELALFALRPCLARLEDKAR